MSRPPRTAVGDGPQQRPGTEPELDLLVARGFEQLAAAYQRRLGALPVTAGLDGATRSRLRLLQALQRGGPQTMRQISRTLGITPAAVTGLADALEGMDMVRRSRPPHDRRTVVLELTPAGADCRLMEAHDAAASALFDVLDDTEKQTLLALVTKLNDALEARPVVPPGA